ncbi:hypothetical protein GCM10022384_25840 [Streptomyces marokkonensis]|uniref:Transposase n=2 Tax=Streptomyces marokkonensis TaxID=324855 RepID=A0ABP7PZV3_9ACTN
MAAPRKYLDELRERAIREVRATGRSIAHVAKDLGIHHRAAGLQRIEEWPSIKLELNSNRDCNECWLHLGVWSQRLFCLTRRPLAWATEGTLRRSYAVGGSGMRQVMRNRWSGGSPNLPTGPIALMR